MVLSYIDELIKQYKDSQGLSHFEKNEQGKKELKAWLKEQAEVCKLYRDYLVRNGIQYTTNLTAEIGKGRYDTVVTSDTETLLLTNNVSDSKKDWLFERAIPGEFIVRDNSCYVMLENKKARSHQFYPLNYIQLFFTQNPYDITKLDNMIKVAQNNKYVLIGAYGKLNDKDKVKKIENLRELKDNLTNCNCKEMYAYVNDNYLYYFLTEPKDVKYLVHHKRKKGH